MGHNKQVKLLNNNKTNTLTNHSKYIIEKESIWFMEKKWTQQHASENNKGTTDNNIKNGRNQL